MSDRTDAFARDAATGRYYDRRAAEYDEWYIGAGLFADRDRPGWDKELRAVVSLLAALPPAPSLDVACGTAFLSQHLRGPIFGVDRSPSMVAIARSRLAGAFVGDALGLPVASNAVDRALAGHFYGHLAADERTTFLSEARRIASELIVVDSALRPGVEAEGWQERLLNDGSRHAVFKRYLRAEQLAAELDGSVLFSGSWFVAARAGGT